jgi:chemotaxis-related protein WspB
LTVLHLIFRLEGQAYALEASRIAEILPWVDALQAAHGAAGGVNAINYRGDIVALVDLAVLTLGRTAERRLSTRIVLAHAPKSGKLVGLIAENATEIARIAPGDFKTTDLAGPGRDHLGSIAIGPHGPIQRIELDCLLLAAGYGDPPLQRSA